VLKPAAQWKRSAFNVESSAVCVCRVTGHR
jgi:hypothetical protein